MERRREPRLETGFSLRVWGVDRDGKNFVQDVQASNISLSGALISHLNQELRAGDLIGVEYGEIKSRFRVVWTRQSGTDQRVQAAIHRLSGDACPWVELLPAETAAHPGASP